MLVAKFASHTPPARAATISHAVLYLMHSIGFMKPKAKPITKIARAVTGTVPAVTASIIANASIRAIIPFTFIYDIIFYLYFVIKHDL